MREIDAGIGEARIGLSERSRRDSMRAEHAIGVTGEPAIHPDYGVVTIRQADLVDVEPGNVALGLARPALAEEQDVDDHISPGIGPKAALGQADGGDEVGGFRDMLAYRAIRLVQRARARDERRQTAGLQEVDRPSDEIVMQAHPHRPIGPIRTHGAIREGRVADDEVERCRQVGTRKVGIDDARPRLQQPGNAGGDRIDLDAGDMHPVPQLWRHQGGEQAGADAGFEHPAAAPAEPQQARPHRPDNELWREMGVLRAARQRGIVLAGHRILELGADLIPAVPESGFARTAEHGIGEVGGAEAGEPDEPGLFFRRRRPVVSLDLRGEPNGVEIVAGALPPALG